MEATNARLFVVSGLHNTEGLAGRGTLASIGGLYNGLTRQAKRAALVGFLIVNIRAENGVV